MKYYDEGKMRGIREALEKDIMKWPGVARKQMMGCLCYFRGKKFFALLVTKGIVIAKLTEDDRTNLSGQVELKLFEMSEEQPALGSGSL